MAQTTDVALLQRCHDFELELSLAAAERVEPRLAAFREELEGVAKAPVVLAGSGSAYASSCDRWIGTQFGSL